MNHIKCQNKICTRSYTDPVSFAFMQLDFIFKGGIPDFYFYLFKHTFLKISCDYFPGAVKDLCHFNGKETGTTTEIEDSHPRPDIWF